MLIDSISRIIEQNGISVFRLAVYDDGNVSEREFLVANDCNNVYSVSKNFTAAAVGILFDRGLLTPDTRVREVLEPLCPKLWRTLDRRWDEVTVKHLLTQTTGHGGMLLDVDCDDVFSYETQDYLEKVLTHPLVYNPGSQFAYTDSNYYLLSRIVARVSSESLQSFVAREILTPLKAQGFAWSTCPQGHAMGGTRLFITTRDMLNFGRMLLDDGVFDGKRVLSKAFIDEATSPQVVTGDISRYGYSFWMRENSSCYHCSGMHGQRIFIDKKHRRVVAWQALDKRGGSNAVLDYLYGK